MKFDDKELRAIKNILTEKLDSIANPSVPQMLSKDIAYLKVDCFDENSKVVIPIQTALRKIIEEIIMRQVNGSGKEA